MLKEYSDREMTLLSDNIEKFKDLDSETHGCFGEMTLSLAKHGGAVVKYENDPDKVVASLKRAYKRNQELNTELQGFDPITHTRNEETQ